MSKPVPALLPQLAGAIAALGVALLVGWPGRPPLAEPALVTAALAMALVAALLVVRAAAAGRRPAARPRPAIAAPTPLSASQPPAPPSELLAA